MRLTLIALSANRAAILRSQATGLEKMEQLAGTSELPCQRPLKARQFAELVLYVGLPEVPKICEDVLAPFISKNFSRPFVYSLLPRR